MIGARGSVEARRRRAVPFSAYRMLLLTLVRIKWYAVFRQPSEIVMIGSDIERIIKEAENRANSIDKILSTLPLDRVPAEALRVVATELVLIRAELTGLRMAVAGAGKAAIMARRRGLKKLQKSPDDPSRVTYYVAIQFVRRPDGSLVAQRPVECANADAAIACAKAMTRDEAGAIAFSRTGDSDRGEFDPAVVLAKFGEVPDDTSVAE
jgi:hypothetical protein